MALMQLVWYVLSVATRQSAVEFSIHALASILLLSAEILAIMATGDVVGPAAIQFALLQ